MSEILFGCRINGEQTKVPVTELSDRDLAWWIENAKNNTMRDVATDELARRANGGARSVTSDPVPDRQAQTVQLVKVGDGGLLKTVDDVIKKIAELQGSCHLVNAPAIGCGIPDGCAVAWSVVRVQERDTYKIKGDANKVGLGKDALNSIAIGMGVQWDPVLSRRLDDASNPHYCRYLAVGKMRDSDGTWITVFDEKENDLRDGSQQAKDMTENQLAQQRANIWSLTVTKARNRAIRGRGVKCAYQRNELAKPFVSLKLIFTGESSDPEIRRMKARAMLDSSSALYGGHAAPPVFLKPPPVNTTGYSLDDEDGIPEM